MFPALESDNSKEIKICVLLWDPHREALAGEKTKREKLGAHKVGKKKTKKRFWR